MLDDIASRRTLYAAFDRVRDNAGCRGADGVTVGEFAANLERELDSLQDRLLRRVYQPYPLLRFDIPKNETKVRALCVPAVRDRVLQTAVYLVTRPVFEAEFEACSYAYREGRSVRDAVLRIDQLRRQGFRWLVDADIDSFFDNIAHDRLLAQLARLPLDPYVRILFERWVGAEIYDGKRVYPLQRDLSSVIVRAGQDQIVSELPWSVRWDCDGEALVAIIRVPYRSELPWSARWDCDST